MCFINVAVIGVVLLRSIKIVAGRICEQDNRSKRQTEIKSKALAKALKV
jgi:hypothetical protein